MRTNLATRAGLLGVASAAALSLASAPAQAAAITQQAPTAAAPSTVQRAAAAEAVFGQAAAKRAKWVTLKHESGRYGYWGPSWNRKYGHRVMQVKARCWGKGQTMIVKFMYRNQYLDWKTMKKAKWPCDGTPRYLRVTNAGHKKYGAIFIPSYTQTIEYWAQSYG
ncbi:hypothetical protein AB0B56_07365 [Streptosporangium canum]|uniref:hypothetical protein n=1 Tax=Streptosporangium canum TaxID=324952 RepID=UPI003428728B